MAESPLQEWQLGPERAGSFPGRGRQAKASSVLGWPCLAQNWAGSADLPLSTWPPQLLQTTNNSPMNSKPQQIKMQSTKKGPLSKREEGGPSGVPAAGVPPPGDEASSIGTAQAASSSGLQPQVSRASFGLWHSSGSSKADNLIDPEWHLILIK